MKAINPRTTPPADKAGVLARTVEDGTVIAVWDEQRELFVVYDSEAPVLYNLLDIVWYVPCAAMFKELGLEQVNIKLPVQPDSLDVTVRPGELIWDVRMKGSHVSAGLIDRLTGQYRAYRYDQAGQLVDLGMNKHMYQALRLLAIKLSG